MYPVPSRRHEEHGASGRAPGGNWVKPYHGFIFELGLDQSLLVFPKMWELSTFQPIDIQEPPASRKSVAARNLRSDVALQS